MDNKIVEQESGCKFWTGAINACGYGTIGINGKSKLVHRVIYELYYGPIPEGMVIAHHCDQPACCEITHLFLTDVIGNVYDMMKKGRNKRTPEWIKNNSLASKGRKGRLGAILSDEIKEKIRNSTNDWYKKNRNIKKICKYCGNEFIGLPVQLFCNKKCYTKQQVINKRLRQANASAA